LRATLIIPALLVFGACTSSLDGFSGGENSDAGTSGQGSQSDPVLVRCPVDRCPKEKPTCCAIPTMDANDATKNYECRAVGGCADGIPVACRSSADCSASGAPKDNVCCLFLNPGARMLSVACAAPSTCVGNHASLCDKQAPACPEGKICGPDVGSFYSELDTCFTP
jgi:hypothetical protein